MTLQHDEALRLARDHQNVLARSKFEQEAERDRSLILISGGALTVTFAFISAFVEHHQLVALGWLIAAWIGWVCALAVTLAAYSLSISVFKVIIDALSCADWAAAATEPPMLPSLLLSGRS
jgi:hypothetical protein